MNELIFIHWYCLKYPWCVLCKIATTVNISQGHISRMAKINFHHSLDQNSVRYVQSNFLSTYSVCNIIGHARYWLYQFINTFVVIIAEKNDNGLTRWIHRQYNKFSNFPKLANLSLLFKHVIWTGNEHIYLDSWSNEMHHYTFCFLNNFFIILWCSSVMLVS